jgi:glyoxylase-like metal-dependent hydrolase (beta-lactamase superfamily II)
VTTIFSLEALQAFHGDCLLLHGGTADAPVLVLVDGGPSRTWETSLRPRLEQLRRERAGDGPLTIDLAMVSHIDDDHVNGMVDFAGELVTQKLDSRPLSYEVRTLWHNSFDDVLGNDADDLRTAAVEVLSQPVGDRRADEIRAAGLAICASVGQGRDLRDQARQLGWGVNEPFDGPVALPKEGVRTITLGDVALTVVGPHAEQLERLHDAWDEWLKEHPKAVAGDGAATAAYADNSPYNLSSIVVLAECSGKRMLLTGDARGDHILANLEAAGLAEGGTTAVDILKLPHHGSIRNLEPEFFERVTARHYVISADGRHGNPETETLETIVAAREDDDFTIHLTNRTGKDDLEQRLDGFLAAKQTSGRGYGVRFREPDAPSLRIDLLGEG